MDLTSVPDLKGTVTNIQPNPSFFGRTTCLFLKCCGKKMERVRFLLKEYERDLGRARKGGRCTVCGLLKGHMWIPNEMYY